MTREAGGNVTLISQVEFGCVGPGGGPVVAWVDGTPTPFITVPAYSAVPATNVPLVGILTALPASGGMYWNAGNFGEFGHS